VVIQSEGYALNGAETGDVVRVRRSGSNDVLTGRLLASGAVGIHE
jgi:flagella basal body P-ring formation protein FlgA